MVVVRGSLHGVLEGRGVGSGWLEGCMLMSERRRCLEKRREARPGTAVHRKRGQVLDNYLFNFLGKMAWPKIGRDKSLAISTISSKYSKYS